MTNKEDLHAEIELDKLILLYVLKKLNTPVNSISFSKIVLEKHLMNYYIMQHCLNDLWEVGFVKRIDSDISIAYELTETGNQFLSFFSAKIPYVMRESIKKSTLDMKDNLKKESEIFAEYHENENGGWIVTCGVYENTCPVLEIKALTGSRNEAHDICANWKQKINTLYPCVMSVLLGGKNSE